jgi:hypothetical protein
MNFDLWQERCLSDRNRTLNLLVLKSSSDIVQCIYLCFRTTNSYPDPHTYFIKITDKLAIISSYTYILINLYLYGKVCLYHHDY